MAKQRGCQSPRWMRRSAERMPRASLQETLLALWNSSPRRRFVRRGTGQSLFPHLSRPRRRPGRLMELVTCGRRLRLFGVLALALPIAFRTTACSSSRSILSSSLPPPGPRGTVETSRTSADDGPTVRGSFSGFAGAVTRLRNRRPTAAARVSGIATNRSASLVDLSDFYGSTVRLTLTRGMPVTRMVASRKVS